MTSPDTALADTSVWIDPPADGMTAHAATVAVSMVSIAELQYGLTTGGQLQMLARRRRLQAILAHHQVVHLDLPTTELFGVFARMLRDIGRNPRPRRFDLLIAATAARHQMTLLTRDRDGFVGLEAALRVVHVG